MDIKTVLTDILLKTLTILHQQSNFQITYSALAFKIILLM